MAHDLYPLPPPDLTRVLEQHLATAFPPDLAFDLVLNELVVRAADAIGASTAALALLRGDELVWRAATGPHGPGLGTPLSTREGLSGVCVRNRTLQLCHDAESDPRADSTASQSPWFRSMLIVPVFDEKPDELPDLNTQPEVVGVLEVFSPVPHAFSEASQSLLEEFAREASHVRRAAEHLGNQIATNAPSDVDLLKSFESTTTNFHEPAAAVATVGQAYEGWTLVLGGLVILAAIGVSFMVGSRVGWLGSQRPIAPPPAAVSSALSVPQSAPAESPAAPSAEVPRTKPTKAKAKQPAASPDNPPDAASGDLVVYEKGKVIFRLKAKSQARASASNSVPDGVPAAPLTHDKTRSETGSQVVQASSSKRIASHSAVWLAPNEAEQRLLSRVDPPYPADAIAAHRSGNVVLEVKVGEDGTVTSVRPLLGDPLLARAAAAAVRSWRYQPYRSHDQPSSFQTDVTMTFQLSN
jgi:TonB family protein